MAIGAALATGSTVSSVGATTTDDCECQLADSAGWSSYRGNAGNTGAILSDGAVPKPEEIAWTYNEASGTPAVVDGAVYLADDEVNAVDAETGETLWTSSEVGADGVPAVVDDTVVVSSDDQLLAFETETGERQWSQSIETAADVPHPTAGYGNVYVASETDVFAFDLTEGSLEWSHGADEFDVADDFDDSDLESVSFAAIPLAVSNGLVYAAVGDDDDSGDPKRFGFVAFDARTGEIEWTYWHPYGAYRPHGNLIATDDRLYTGRYSDTMFYPVLDTETGEMVTDIMFMSPPVVTDDVRITSDRYGFSAYNFDTGESWSPPPVAETVDEWGGPKVVGETVLAIHGDRATIPEDDAESILYGLDLADGSEQWTFPLSDIGIDDPVTAIGLNPIAVEDTIYLSLPGSGDGGGRLVAVRPAASDDDDGGSETGDADKSNDDEPDGSGESDDDGDTASDEDSDEKTADDDGGNETTDGDGGTTSDDETTDPGDTARDGNSDDENTDTGTGSDDGTAGSDTNGSDETDGAEGSPGFTTGVGLASGGLTLEWLRRRVTDDDPEPNPNLESTE